VLPRRIPVIDCWRILKRDESGSIDVVWLGYGAQTGVSFEAAL
jgi:hypothetical protein